MSLTTDFQLPRVRSGRAYRLDRSIPRRASDWERYEFNGTVRGEKPEDPEDKTVSYSERHGYGEQRNWYGHASPDQLPKYTSLHPTHQQVLGILLHRCVANGVTDTKMHNSEIARLIDRSERHVERIIKDLVDMGFLGLAVVRQTGERKGVRYMATWRMIRVHLAGFLLRWTTLESPTWLRTDYRPDSQRGAHRDSARSYNRRVGQSGKIHLSWFVDKPKSVFDPETRRSVEVHPKIDPFFGPIMTAIRQGYVDQAWYDTHGLLLHDVDDGVDHAIRVIGFKVMNKDLEHPQLIQ